MSLSFGSIRYQTTIGHRISAEQWDNSRSTVHDGVANSNGMSAEIINATIHKLKCMAHAMDRISATGHLEVKPFMLKGAVKDLLSDELTSPDDIAAKWLYAKEPSTNDKIEYYKDRSGHYYKNLGRAIYVQYGSAVRVIKEMFGEGRILVEPVHLFDTGHSTCKYQRATEDEAFGRTAAGRGVAGSKMM